MKQEDKLSEISTALPVEDCGICGNHTHVFKTVSIPCKLIIQMMMCRDEKQITGKKNKTQTVNMLNMENFKMALEAYKPRFHFLNLCSECANVSMAQARLPSDPEYGVTNLIPQNQNDNGVVNERLLIFPFIAPENIQEGSNPNESRLSFARQWLRGFISKNIGLDPAGNDCLLGSLMFLTSLANDKDTARMIFANQTSLLRGGRIDRYPQTVGRLFKPNTQKISAEVLTLISLVQEVIDLTGMQTLPEANKLLLLCLLDRRISILIHAKNMRTRATENMDKCIKTIFAGQKSEYTERFGIDQKTVDAITHCKSAESFKVDYDHIYNQCIATYLQQYSNLDLKNIAFQEEQLMKIIQSSSIKDMAKPLNINEDHLRKMVERSQMDEETFVNMVPKFIKGMINVDAANKMGVMMQFI